MLWLIRSKMVVEITKDSYTVKEILPFRVAVFLLQFRRLPIIVFCSRILANREILMSNFISLSLLTFSRALKYCNLQDMTQSENHFLNEI